MRLALTKLVNLRKFGGTGAAIRDRWSREGFWGKGEGKGKREGWRGKGRVGERRKGRAGKGLLGLRVAPRVLGKIFLLIMEV